jgi:hypothetical protein
MDVRDTDVLTGPLADQWRRGAASRHQGGERKQQETASE